MPVLTFLFGWENRGICVAVKGRKQIDILYEKCYSIIRFCENVG